MNEKGHIAYQPVNQLLRFGRNTELAANKQRDDQPMCLRTIGKLVSSLLLHTTGRFATKISLLHKYLHFFAETFSYGMQSALVIQ